MRAKMARAAALMLGIINAGAVPLTQSSDFDLELRVPSKSTRTRFSPVHTSLIQDTPVSNVTDAALNLVQQSDRTNEMRQPGTPDRMLDVFHARNTLQPDRNSLQAADRNAGDWIAPNLTMYLKDLNYSPAEIYKYGVNNGFKVFVYDLPPALNEDLVTCYFKENGVNIWEDDRKERGQNIADIWMHKLLETHHSRTKDATQATAFFVPYYGFLSSFLGDRPCNGHTHVNRVQLLASFLHQSAPFSFRPTSHFLVVSYWNAISKDESEAVIAGPLFPMLKDSIILLYEKQFGSTSYADAWKAWTGPLVTIPYVAHHQITNAVPMGGNDRVIAFYFRGNLQLDQGSKSAGATIRNRIINVFQGLPQARIVDSSSEFSPEAYIDDMLHSTFCLVPRGDTPSSRRLFDALVAGCIPVIVSDQIALPFVEDINWGSFSLQMQESDLFNYASTVINKLRNLPKGQIEDLQTHVLKSRPDFIYGRGNPFGQHESGECVNHILKDVERRVSSVDGLPSSAKSK